MRKAKPPGRPGRTRQPADDELVKISMHLPRRMVRQLKAYSEYHAVEAGSVVQAALLAGPLYGFSLTVQEPERRGAKPLIEVYRPESAGEGSDLAG